MASQTLLSAGRDPRRQLAAPYAGAPRAHAAHEHKLTKRLLLPVFVFKSLTSVQQQPLS